MRVMPLLALLLVSAMWGSHPVVGQVVEHRLSPLALTVWRFTFGALCYIPFYGRLRALLRLPRRQFWQLAFCGMCGSVLYPLFYYQSLLHLTSVESLLLVNTSPLLAAVFAWLVLHERLHTLEWIGIGVSFGGVFVLFAAQSSGGGTSWLGAVLAVLAAAAFAGYTVSSRSLFQKLPLVDVLLCTSLWGALYLWMVALFSGHVGAVAGALTEMTGASWTEFAYIVLIVSTFAYVLYGYGLKRVPAAVSSAVTFYPQVIFAAIIGWIWFGQVPSAATWVSGAFILLGTSLMQKRRKV